MQQLQILLGENATKYMLWSVLGLVALVALLLLFIMARRLFGSAFNMSATGDKRNRPPRLGVTDFFNLDRYGRRLVIVRRDNVEHLLLIGGPNDVLIEQNIIRGLRPELPIIEPSSRPTVAPKPTEEPFLETPKPIINTPSTKALQPAAVPKPSPVLTTPPVLTPLTAFTSRVAPLKPAAPPAEIKPLPPIQILPLVVEKPKLEALSEPIKIVEPELVTKIEPIAHVEKVIITEQALTHEPASKVEPLKQMQTTSFSDATKRLEEALRRPITVTVSKPQELQKQELQKNVDQRKIEPVIAVEKPLLTEQTPEIKVTKSDSLVLDLEQEMARLLGRSPNKPQ